jgi:PKD repeat protein
MRMNKKNILACTLSMLAVASLLLVAFACLIVPTETAPRTVTATSGAQYSYENLYARNTVFNNHAFSYALSSTLSSDIRDIATGYLNNDSITDVVVATGTQIKIYFGNGDGSLGTPFVVPFVMSDIRKIAIGDLDRDGTDDIAATYYDSNSGLHRVGIFYQKNTFSSTVDQHPDTKYDPWQVLIGDFTNTGVNSLAVICRGDSAKSELAGLLIIKSTDSSFTGSKNQRFIEISGLANLKLLAAGNINSDGRLDLVAGDAYSNTIVTLIQPESFVGTWSISTMDIGGSIADIGFMDYSGTGLKKDLVVVKSGQSSGQVEIRLNDGTIPTAASSTMTVSGAIAFAAGSVTGSSYPDLVILSSSENRAFLFPRQGTGVDKSNFFKFPVNTGLVKAVTVNGGIYVLSNGNYGALEYYRYVDSDISNADGSRFTVDGRPTEVSAGDVSFGIIAATYAGQNKVYISSLSGESRIITTSSVPTSLYIGDLDEDGIGDLAILFQSSNMVSIYKGSSSFMTNNNPVTIQASSSLSNPQSITGGYIDAINENVLVVGCNGGIDVIYNPLSGSPVHEILTTSETADQVDVALGRLNPTGASGGIAALGYGQSYIEIFYIKQSPTIGDCYDSTYNAKLLTSGLESISIAVGDFNGDGRDDVAAATQDQLKIFNNAGFSSGTPTTSVTLPAYGSRVRSADLNDDGRDDLAVSYSSRATIGIWLSKDTFSFSNKFNMTAGGIASGISLGDLNGDDRADILASSSTSSAISYWIQNDLVPATSVWISSTTIDVNNTISFDASNSTDSYTDRSSLTYYWNFGDGSTSTEKTAQHMYTVAGTYNGYLLVTDRSGLTGRADFVIKVNNPLRADFGVSAYTVMVGEEIYVYDASDAPNSIQSRSWDLGNDQTKGDVREFYVTYSKPGSYTITLTVTDMAGKVDTESRTVTVLQASNTIEGIVAGGGRTTFYMDQEISFEVRVNTSMPSIVYSWDMDYDTTTKLFNQTPGITINQTTWSYHRPGEHTICVRFYDQELTEKRLTIYIINPRPVPQISASLSKPSNFTFDAKESSDTVTDMNAGFEYRWNFGDGSGWKDWTRDTKAWCNYTSGGIFTVTLEVKDQWGLVNSTTYLAIVDTSAPTIDLDQSLISQAYRGEDLIVKVNVTDLSSVKEVLLIYTSNNQTKTLVMTRISGTDTYVATIPAKDVIGDLSYYIDAVDDDGRHSVTAAMTINLTDRPNNVWMYAVLAAAAVLGAILLLYYRIRVMIVDDVFIIYQDGNLMAHQTRRLKPGMDDQILGSMLVAIQDFVRDSFKDESSTGLNRMDFGEQKVLVEKGDFIYLAVVLHGQYEGRVPQRMKDAISRAESTYSQALEGWDGDLEKVRGIKDETDPLLKGTLRDIVSSIPFINRGAAGPTEMTACPKCGTACSPKDTTCPKCGTAVDKRSPGVEDRDTGGPAA